MNWKPSKITELTPEQQVVEAISTMDLAEEWGVPGKLVPEIAGIMTECLDILEVPAETRIWPVNLQTALMMALDKYFLEQAGYKMVTWNHTLWHKAYNMSLSTEPEERFEQERRMATDDLWVEEALEYGNIQEL